VAARFSAIEQFEQAARESRLFWWFNQGGKE
jgi:hypothetical protein